MQGVDPFADRRVDSIDQTSLHQAQFSNTLIMIVGYLRFPAINAWDHGCPAFRLVTSVSVTRAMHAQLEIATMFLSRRTNVSSSLEIGCKILASIVDWVEGSKIDWDVQAGL